MTAALWALGAFLFGGFLGATYERKRYEARLRRAFFIDNVRAWSEPTRFVRLPFEQERP